MKFSYQRIVLKNLEKAQIGGATVRLPDGSSLVFGQSSKAHTLELQVKDKAFFREIVLKGGIGLGEAYQRDFWRSNDLTGILQWLLVNSPFIAPKISPMLAGLARKGNQFLDTFLHFKNRNTIAGSRENIHAHYDLGNTFYATFLDPSMTYSSAYFTSPNDSLEKAQEEKYDRLCRKLGINSLHHVLEIGCGWGGFAIHAAKNYNCCVTSTTISKEQYREATRRVNAAGLQERIHVTMTDYRKLEGKFDRIASIEMLEAVGKEFLGTYFQQVENLLEPDGLAGVQVITCPNPLYEDYSKRVDWIQKHIFPGSHLPSPRALIENAETHGQLETYHMESFGVHYARTLREWRIQFLKCWDKISRQGFDDAFKRKWEYYLAYCEAGFLERHVNVCQLILGRADETAYSYESAHREETLSPQLFRSLTAL